jgi:hypothetical protein
MRFLSLTALASIGAVQILLAAGSGSAFSREPEDIEVRIAVIYSGVASIHSGAATDVVAGSFEGPRLRVQFKNRGPADEVVILPVWGCASEGRKICYRWSMTRDDGTPVSRFGGSACEVVAPLVTSDFVTLGPKGSFEFDQDSTPYLSSPWSWFDLSVTGIYQLSLTYCYDPDGENQFPSSRASAWPSFESSPETATLLKAAHAVRVRSTPLRLRVVDSRE